MATLLQINASIFGAEGQSTRLAAAYAARWQATHPGGSVVIRDLAAAPVPHLTAERFQGFFLAPEARSLAQVAATEEADVLINELKDADEVVLGLPMYNFTLPSTLKAWFDHVARAGTTFRYTATGPEGLIGDKPVHIFAARGGQYAGTPADTQSALLRTFFGFLGLEDVRFVYAEGLARGGDAAKEVMAGAIREIDQLATRAIT